MLFLALAAVLSLGIEARAPDAQSDAFKAAYAQKSAGKFEAAAAAFETIATTYPTSPRLGEALVEAGVAWFGFAKTRMVLERSTPGSDEAFAKAHSCFASVANDHPADPAAGRAQYMLGSTSLFQGDLAGAEKEYDIVLEKFTADVKYVPKSLERRAAVRRHLLEDDLALADLVRYQEKYPKGDEADSVARYIQLAAMNGKPAPALDPEAWLQGGPFTLGDLRGRVVGIYFFATWCEKCQKALPFVLELDRRMAPSGFVLIGVLTHSKGQTNASVTKYLGEERIHFAAMMDKARTRPAYFNQNIPDLVLIDKAGRVRWHDHPASLSDYTIETLLGETTEPPTPASPK